MTAAQVDSETQGAEELAEMVWKFVNAAGGLVDGLDGEVSAYRYTTAPHRSWKGVVPDLLLVGLEADLDYFLGRIEVAPRAHKKAGAGHRARRQVPAYCHP